MSRLPDFLIIGAAKCGTTSLFEQLGQHPLIHTPAIKEPTFFSSNGVGTWDKGLEWYQSIFVEAQSDQLTGEASTSYSKAPWYGDAPEKIHQFVPDVKLIYMVRDPIAQILSHYQHMDYDELDTRTLEERLINDDFLLKVASYAYQLEQFLPFFDKHQIHVICLEDYIDSNAEVMSKLFDFLSIPAHSTQPIRENARRQRQILRWKWLRHIPSIKRMTPFERQQQLRPWALAPQQKVRIHSHLKNQLWMRLSPQMHLLKTQWGITLPNW